MITPTVSIIMSTYNDASYIKQAINSVIQQSVSDWEFIIFNDASVDDTDEIIKALLRKDNRIVYINNKQNLGQSHNENEGVRLAKGEFIAKIDGDDIWEDKDKLKKQIEFLRTHSEYGLVGSFWITINSKGEEISRTPYLTTDKEIRKYLLIENCFNHSTVVIRKSILDKVGNYNTQYYWAQDYDLWLRIGTISKLYNMPEFMIKCRINPKGITQTNYKKQLEDTYKIIKNYRNEYPNFIKGYILWHLRPYLPKWTRQQMSEKNKIVSFFRYFKYNNMKSIF